MNLLEVIGMIWVVFTSALGSFAVFYCVYTTARNASRQYLRGQVEEGLDVKRAVEANYQSFSGGRAAR